MWGIVKILSNALLVVGGFFVVFFGVSKVTQQSSDRTVPFAASDADIAYADIPYSQASYGDSGGDGADSGGDGGDGGK